MDTWGSLYYFLYFYICLNVSIIKSEKNLSSSTKIWNNVAHSIMICI